MSKKKGRKNKILWCYFPNLQLVHLTKDPVQIPNAISELYGYKSYIITNCRINDSQLKLFAPYVSLILLKQFFTSYINKPQINSWIHRIVLSINRKFQPFNFVFLLLLNLGKIDHLYLYNFGSNTNFDVAVFGIIYKLFNPKGILHIRLEIGISDLSKNFPLIKESNFKSFFFNKFYLYFIKKTNILGVIDDKDFSVSRSYPVFWGLAKEKIKQQLNGYKIVYNEKVLSFDEKENIIAIVGRLYSDEKGLIILLEAMENLDLKDWTLLLIGELDNHMREYIEIYLNRNKVFRNKFIILGNVVDKALYYSYLNRVKIFCTPLKYDGISLAQVENQAFGNVPVVTDFPGMRICTNNGKYGFLFRSNDINELNLILDDLINDNEKLKRYSFDIKKFTEQNFKWENIIKSLKIEDINSK